MKIQPKEKSGTQKPDFKRYERLERKVKTPKQEKFTSKLKMATTVVTYEEARAQVGTLPTCHPRPNSTNIRQVVKVLSERVAGIPSTQSQDNGYYGMVVTWEECALVSNKQWQDFPDPGPVRGAIDGNATSTE